MFDDLSLSNLNQVIQQGELCTLSSSNKRWVLLLLQFLNFITSTKSLLLLKSTSSRPRFTHQKNTSIRGGNNALCSHFYCGKSNIIGFSSYVLTFLMLELTSHSCIKPRCFIFYNGYHNFLNYFGEKLAWFWEFPICDPFSKTRYVFPPPSWCILQPLNLVLGPKKLC